MPDTPSLLTSVRERRVEAGLSQTELAATVGVSRQGLSAIESGRQVPSTTLSLHLARALGCTVDDIFRLPGGPRIEAELARDPHDARRVVLGRVEGRLVAHPLSDDTHAADGLLVDRPRPQRPPETTSASAPIPVSATDTTSGAAAGFSMVEAFADPASISGNLLVAGCAPLLGLLAERLGRRYRDVRGSWIPANSMAALSLLRRRMVHVAGIHLASSDDPDAHDRAARETAWGSRATLVNLARWRQGLVVAPGNPLGIGPGSELLRPGLRFALRDPGAGAQRLLERELARAGGRATELSGPAGLAADHVDVARLVRWGVADVGVAIESVAIAHGLDFLPLAEERFDLIVTASAMDDPAVSRFLDLIDRPSFRAEAAGIPGYDLSQAGTSSTVARL